MLLTSYSTSSGLLLKSTRALGRVVCPSFAARLAHIPLLRRCGRHAPSSAQVASWPPCASSRRHAGTVTATLSSSARWPTRPQSKWPWAAARRPVDMRWMLLTRSFPVEGVPGDALLRATEAGVATSTLVLGCLFTMLGARPAASSGSATATAAAERPSSQLVVTPASAQSRGLAAGAKCRELHADKARELTLVEQAGAHTRQDLDTAKPTDCFDGEGGSFVFVNGDTSNGGANGWGGSWGGSGGSGGDGTHGRGFDGASSGDELPRRGIAAVLLAMAAALAFWRTWSPAAPQLLPHADSDPWVSSSMPRSCAPPEACAVDGALVGASAGCAGRLWRDADPCGKTVGRRLSGWASWLPLSSVQLLQQPLGSLPLPEALTTPLRREREYWAHQNPYGFWHGGDGWQWRVYGQPPLRLAAPNGAGCLAARSWPYSYSVFVDSSPSRQLSRRPGLRLPTAEPPTAPGGSDKAFVRGAPARSGGGKWARVSLQDEIAALAAVRDRLHSAHRRAEVWLGSCRADVVAA